MAENRDSTVITPGQGPALDTAAIGQHLAALKTMLSSLEPKFDALNKQSAGVTELIPTMHATSEQIKALHDQIFSQDRKSNMAIEKIKQNVGEKLQGKIMDSLTPGMQKKIKAEMSLQIPQQVAVQIKDHLPVSLEQQVAESKKQFAEMSSSLTNAEARRNNSILRHQRGFDQPLTPVLTPSGNESRYFPSNLKALFLYDLNKSKALVKDYGLPESKIREENFNKFMSHIGIHNSLAIVM